MRTRILWKILGAYIFLVLVAVLVLDLSVVLKLRSYYQKKISDTLESNAFLASDILKKYMREGDEGLVQGKTADLAGILGLRVTVIDRTGNVLGDSETEPAEMESHLDREEVIAAINKGIGESDRYSDTLGMNMKYMAVPVKDSGGIIGIIRFAVPLTEIDHELGVINKVFLLGGLLAVLVTCVIGYFLSKNISLPIRRMEEAARSIAKGDFTKEIDIRTNDELGGLAVSLNRMARELKIKINNLEKLDKIRTDFVANVSHELKTPLTSIKGFIETLEDGAIDDKENARRFLDIIKKHADRLSNIINDLLSLTEIESREGALKAAAVDMKALLDEVIWSFTHAFSAKGQQFNASYNGTDFKVKGDRDKIEQVLVNLIDNAIKYTGQKGEIRASLFEKKDSVMLTLTDNGIGIPEEHLDRIFERFYRVDKGRSRELGGTGLGLSIVKHIVMLHNGHIGIESETGKGTEITVIFPK